MLLIIFMPLSSERLLFFIFQPFLFYHHFTNPFFSFSFFPGFLFAFLASPFTLPHSTPSFLPLSDLNSFSCFSLQVFLSFSLSYPVLQLLLIFCSSSFFSALSLSLSLSFTLLLLLTNSYNSSPVSLLIYPRSMFSISTRQFFFLPFPRQSLFSPLFLLLLLLLRLLLLLLLELHLPSSYQTNSHAVPIRLHCRNNFLFISLFSLFSPSLSLSLSISLSIYLLISLFFSLSLFPSFTLPSFLINSFFFLSLCLSLFYLLSLFHLLSLSPYLCLYSFFDNVNLIRNPL